MALSHVKNVMRPFLKNRCSGFPMYAKITTMTKLVVLAQCLLTCFIPGRQQPISVLIGETTIWDNIIAACGTKWYTTMFCFVLFFNSCLLVLRLRVTE